MVSNTLKRRKKGIVIASIVFIALMIAPIALVGVYVQTNNSLTTQEITQQSTLSDLAAIALKIKLDDLVSIGSSLASYPSIVDHVKKREWADAANVARDLENQVSFYDPFIDRVIIDDASATQQGAYPELVGGLGTNASDSLWYKSLSSGKGAFYVTDALKRISVPHIEVVNIVTPIKSQDHILGYLLLQIPTDNFLKFGENLSLGTYGFAYVVDTQGNIVAHPKFSSDNGTVVNYKSVPEVARVIQGNSGTDILPSWGSAQGSVITYKPVDTYGWGIVIQQLYAEVFAARSVILFEVGLLIGALTIINILIAYIIFRVITHTHIKNGQ